MTTNTDWTVETFAAYTEALRRMEDRLHSERDRRYSEVKAAEEKALKVKEVADRDALDLARQIQAYKDEKANELREQINSERGLYATKHDLQSVAEKLDAVIKPLADYIAVDRGRGAGMNSSWQILVAAVGLIFTLLSIGTVVVTVVLYVSRTQPAIYTPAPAGTQLPTSPPAAVPR